MLVSLAPAPVSADGGDGEPADEDGAPGPAGGRGPADAPRSGAAAGARSQNEPDGPPEIAVAANRSFGTEGICAVGDTLWIGYRGDSTLQAFDRSTGERDEASDITVADPARGMWCDGETLWYTTKLGNGTIFAYDMATGTRKWNREFDISGLSFSTYSGGSYWYGALGIASDGDTMWVASNSEDTGNQLYALDMATKAHKPGSDIALGRHFHPRGLFTDGEFLWVASSINSTVRAYDTSTLERVESLDLKVDDFEHDGSWGLWSDGEHMWVCNFRYGKVRAHPMPKAYGPRLETLEVSGVELVRLSSREFRGHVARGAASVTVTAAANDDAHTVTFGTADADDGTEGHQWSLDLGDNTLEITMSDGTTSRTYTITVVKIDVDALSDDATLNSLTVDGTEVDGFTPDVGGYRLRVDNDVASATVAATATEAAAQVTISPADADPGTEGHQVALDVGANPVTVAVAATDGIATAAYTLTIGRKPLVFGHDSFLDISGLEHRRSMDIWAGARTRWVSYDRSGDEAVLAYHASTGERTPGRDIAARAAGNRSPQALWSDGEVLYVLDTWKSMVFQYSLADGAGFGAHAATVSLEGIGEDDARGLWSNGETMWVADTDDAKLYAYALDDGARRPDLDLDTLRAAGNSMPMDLWSDGQVMWILDKGDGKVYAYDLDSKARLEHLDFEALEPRNDWPSGLWSNGGHMWVSDADDTRAYAYVMPAALALDTLEVSGTALARPSLTEYRGRVARGTASVTVTAEPADSAHTVTFGTNDADDSTEGHQWSLALGDNTLEVTVSDGTDSRTYTITVTRVDVDALSDDATLSSLTVDGAAVDGFAADVHHYTLRVDHDVASATVTAAAAETAAEVTITPADADPDPGTDGHQVALDVGSNVVTVAVAATDGVTGAAYTLTLSRRGDPDQPPEMAVAFNRSFGTEGICAVGDTLWIGYRGDSTLQAFDRSTGERDEASDITVADPARGMWCDGETLWYTTKLGNGTIFAYDMATGTRKWNREFDISGLSFSTYSGGSYWYGALGIASDGDTMWVASNSEDTGNQLYALDMATKAHKPGSDIALGRHFHPRGLFSDGEFLWVASSLNSTVRAYDTSTLERVESLDLEVDDFEHDGSWGLWSDGEHMWVCNFRYGKVRAHPMPEAYGPHLETLEVSGVELVRLSSTEFRGHVARDAASVTVTAAANDDAHTVTFGTADADDGTEGHQWSLDLGDNTLEITVSDGTTSRTYTITVVKIDVDALSDDATLGSLSVDGAAVDGFAADVHHYTLRVANDVASVTVAATATVAAAEVTISPADADPGTEGHQVALARGLNRVTVAVAATDRVAEAAYRLEFFRELPAEDVDGFGEPGHRLAYLWSNGATVWVSEPAEDAIEAYDLASGERRGSNVIGTLKDAGNEWARGVWSDGDTIWVADHEDDKLYAYELDGGARRPDLDIDTLEAAGNTSPRGIWSNSDTMWVADAGDRKLYAYELDGGARQPDLDIDTLEAAGNSEPRDIWSDGDTVWVADSGDAKLYAYALDGGARRPDLDFDTQEAAGNTNPRGIWSNGDIMWVSDPGDDKLYSYNMPPAQTGTQQAQQQTQQDDPQQDDPQQDPGQAQQDEQDEQAQQAPALNAPAAGAPVVGGRARVGETLVADMSGVVDADGLSGAVFGFQWVSGDGTTDTDIAGATVSTYVLEAGDAGRFIKVRVSFVDDAGHVEASTSAAAGPVLGDGPPGAPGGLVVTAGDRELTLSWEPPADNGSAPATRYRVEWRIDGKDYDKSHWGISHKTTYTRTHLANGVSYIFWVKAENGNGNSYGPYGPASGEVSGTPTSGLAVDLATPVLSSTKTLHHGMVKLDWQDVEDAGWYVVQHYHIDGGSGEWLDLPAAGVGVALHGSSAVVSNLGGISWLRVRAMSCAGESEWSEIEQLFMTDESAWEGVPVPAVAQGDESEPCPVVLGTPVLSSTKTLHHDMVQLDWQDIEDAGWYVVQHYHIDSGSGQWLDLPAAGVDVAFHGSSAVVSNLGGISWLRVRAMSCAAESEWSEIKQLFMTDESAWDGVPVPAVAPGDEPEPCPEDVDAPDNSAATKETLTSAATKETLTSAATAAVAGAQPTEPPAKPTGLSATASHDSVTLTWNDPGDDSITGYVILRRVRENDVGGDFSELAPDTHSTATTYTDDTVAAGLTYTYRIKAINGAGTSERSRWFHIDTPPAPAP